MINEVLKTYIERSDFFLALTLEHLQISAIAIFFATIIGLFLGVLISERKQFSTPVLAITSFIYTIPSISLLGFLIPFSGIGNKTAIIALTVYALLPMVRNTYTGMLGIDKDILEAAKGMGSTNFQILYKIKLPLALPVILSGFNNMVVMTIALAGIASFIGAGGLGVAIYRGITTNNMSMTIAGSLAVALLALSLDFLLTAMQTMIQKRKTLSLLPLWTILLVLLLIFGSAWQTGQKQKTIKLATKPMTEQLILAEMLSALIEKNTDLKVQITKGVGGGTSNIHPAIVKGNFDLYPEYTGTAWSFVLKKKNTPDKDTLYRELDQEYQKQYRLKWLGLYGFNNTFGLAVRKDLAQQYNLKTYSDLAKFSSQLVYGAEYDFFERDDGYQALCQTYGFNFKKAVDMDIGLKYNAIKAKEIDVVNVFTTDGQLSNSEVLVLIDDKNFFENYYCGTIVRLDTLDRHPELARVLMLMDNIITDSEMSQLNFSVETPGKNERLVATEFLQKKGLLEVAQ